MSDNELYDLEVEWEQRGELDNDLLNSIPTEHVEPGEVLYQQEKEPVEFSVVKLGRLQVTKQSSGGSQTILGLFGPGEPVGALAVVNNFPYPASVEAVKPTVVYRFTADMIPDLKETAPGWFSDCIGHTAERFTDLVDRFQSMTTKSLESRLASYLWKLAEKHGEDEENGILIDTKLTRQMLADMVGCRVESAIRRLSQWEQDGKIKTSESRIKLLKPETIHRLSKDK